MNLGEAMRVRGGRAPGADALRLGLAVGVLVHHAFPLSYGPGEAWAAGQVLVPMFFALSGMLVTRSAERRSLRQFAAARALRIYPALAVVTLACALVLGPILTGLPLREYFRSGGVWRHVLGMTGWTSLTLPGVFEGNPLPRAINGSLWSIPYELACYAVLTGLIGLGLIGRRRVMLGVWAAVLAAGTMPWPEHGAMYRLGQFLWLAGAFASGGVMYLYRERVPLHRGLLLAAAGLAAGAVSLGVRGPVLGPALAYCTVYLAMLPVRPPLGGRDLSYGVYLWAFPVQQVAAMLLAREWWVNVAVSLPVTLGLAGLSWTLVERPALGLKGRGGRTQNREGAGEGGLPVGEIEAKGFMSAAPVEGAAAAA
jgi:peptidoglycan/LPS O-acetylase OafA/YrhL